LSCILKIRETYPEMTPTEKSIADYILLHFRDVTSYTVSELSNRVATSPPSIVRFSKKIGYKGYQDMKLNMVKEMAISENQTDKVYEAVGVHDSIRDIIEKISKENCNAIDETVSVLDEKCVAKAIEAMIEAKHINIFGVSASGLVGMDLYYKLMRINKNASMYMDSHTQMASAIHMREGDVALGISHSGKTLEVYKSMQKAKENGALTISITKYGNNPISELSDINLYTASVEKTLRTGAIASRIAQLTVIDILFVGIAQSNFNDISKYIQATSEIVEDFKIK